MYYKLALLFEYILKWGEVMVPSTDKYNESTFIDAMDGCALNLALI